jgi:3-oxoacyl-[acyl-carrier protein] reductase
MAKLENKFALVTGSSSGIGRAVALAFAREGADVAINYHNASQAKNAAEVTAAIKSMGRRTIEVRADVSKEDEVQKMVDEVIRAFGRIDILVNNAGIASYSPIEAMPIAMWDEMMAVNLRSVFLCTRLVLPLMYKQNYGKIINTASQLGYRGCPEMAHYCASKAAIMAFTRSLSFEIGSRDINANCVAPGATLTPILNTVTDDLMEKIKAGIPKGKIASVDDIAPAYVFLASDDARHFVGQCISPNGGDFML